MVDNLWKYCWRQSTLDELALAEVVQSESIRDVDKTLEYHQDHWTFEELSMRRKLQALTFHVQALPVVVGDDDYLRFLRMFELRPELALLKLHIFAVSCQSRMNSSRRVLYYELTYVAGATVSMTTKNP